MMKKFNKVKILIFFILAIILLRHKVYAVNTTVELIGKNEVKAGERQIINVKITGEDSIGAIEGILKCDSNVDDFEVIGNHNGWTATYNESTGKFNIFNAYGSTEGEVLQIAYVMKESAKSTTISLSDLKLTTIAYDTIALDNNVTKTINRIENNEESSNNKPNTVGQEYPKAEQENEPEKLNNAQSGTTLPATGTQNMTFAYIVIVVATIVAIITFFKIREYKGIE